MAEMTGEGDPVVWRSKEVRLRINWMRAGVAASPDYRMVHCRNRAHKATSPWVFFYNAGVIMSKKNLLNL